MATPPPPIPEGSGQAAARSKRPVAGQMVILQKGAIGVSGTAGSASHLAPDGQQVWLTHSHCCSLWAFPRPALALQEPRHYLGSTWWPPAETALLPAHYLPLRAGDLLCPAALEGVSAGPPCSALSSVLSFPVRAPSQRRGNGGGAKPRSAKVPGSRSWGQPAPPSPWRWSKRWWPRMGLWSPLNKYSKPQAQQDTPARRRRMGLWRLAPGWSPVHAPAPCWPLSTGYSMSMGVCLKPATAR